MSEIDKAERKAMDCLNGWVNAMQPKFNAVEMQALKQRMTAAFREYETEIAVLEGALQFYAVPGNVYGMCDSHLEWAHAETGQAVQAGTKARAALGNRPVGQVANERGK